MAFLGLALVSCLLIGTWALPVWYSNRLLIVAQFPWRLLAIASLPLAPLTGGILVRLRGQPVAGLAGAALLALTIWANHPGALDVPRMGAPQLTVNPVVIAQLEKDPHVPGAAGIQEFTPRWVENPLVLTHQPEAVAENLDLRLLRANGYGLDAQVGSPAGGPLRFSSFYFPGWQITLDGQARMPAYPSTSLGLLTVDLPPGKHALQVRWTGTPVQHGAATLSLVALTILPILALRYVRPVWLALFPLALLVLGLTGSFISSPLQAVQPPAQPVAEGGLQLLGYRWEQDPAGYPRLYPTWYVTSNPRATLQTHWELQDEAGHAVAAVTAAPYSNAASAASWPPGTIQSDAYQIALAPELPAGAYGLAAQIRGTSANSDQPAAHIGTLGARAGRSARGPASTAT
jgi:hypothetical protein